MNFIKTKNKHASQYPRVGREWESQRGREGEGNGEEGRTGRPGEHLGYSARCPDSPTAAPQACEAASRKLRPPAGSTAPSRTGTKKNAPWGVEFHIPSPPLCWRTTESSSTMQACLEDISPPLRLWTFSRSFLNCFLGENYFLQPWPKDKPVSIHSQSPEGSRASVCRPGRVPICLYFSINRREGSVRDWLSQEGCLVAWHSGDFSSQIWGSYWNLTELWLGSLLGVQDGQP